MIKVIRDCQRSRKRRKHTGCQNKSLLKRKGNGKKKKKDKYQ